MFYYVACFGEANLDLKKPVVMEQLYTRLKKIDPHAKLTKSISASKFSETHFKMGGTIMLTRGNWSGHIQKQGSDKLGRWSFQTMEGKDGKKITIINVYRVCKKNNNSGNCTIRSQQETDLLEETGKHLDPREQILIDLNKSITDLHSKGHLVILYGDMNDDIQTSNRISTFLMKSNMKNILRRKHEGELPRTYDRGQNCLDLMAVSNGMCDQAIIRCGYLPFYEGIASDHRAMYIDVSTDYLFSASKPDTNKHIHRRFTTDNPKKTDKYLHRLEEELEKARVFKKVEELKRDIHAFLDNDDGDRGLIIQRCKILAEKTKQLMIHSEKKSR